MPAAHALALLLTAACLSHGCRSTGPSAPAMDASDSGLLDSARTRAELTSQLGVPPRCVALAPGSEGCEWRLRSRDAAYRELARTMDVRDRIGVICALPVNGGPRAKGSCTLHQRRSNRGAFVGPSGKKSPQREAARERLAARASEARAKIESRPTLIEMTRALGQLPDRCDEAAGSGRLCTWVLSNQSFGHGSIAASIDAGLHQKVRFRCRFEPDGRRRAGHCEATAL